MDGTNEGGMQRIAAEYQVNGFPTLKLFVGDKGKKTVKDVETRDIQEIMNLALQSLQELIQTRAKDSAAGSTHTSGSSSGSSTSSGNRHRGHNSEAVVTLTASTIQSLLYESPKVAMVAFVAPWCGHCKALLPEYEQAAQSLATQKADVLLGIVDATVEEDLARQYRVQGYPTIKVFPGGTPKHPSMARDYPGGRDTASMVQHILMEVDKSGVPKEIPELIHSQMMLEECQGTGQICVVAALPHILDSGVEGRNTYRDILTAASKSVRGMSAFTFFWFEGGSNQLDLEDSLELTFGYPALAAFSIDKMVYTVQRSSFSEGNIRKFLLGITSGRQGTMTMTDVPKVATAEPWDGKEGVPFEEESLEDIMGWDDDDDQQEEEL